MSDYAYVGSELELFAKATCWKRYFRSRILRFIGEDVLEVGAGIGGTTRLLCLRPHRRWVCLEPDPRLGAEMQHRFDVEPPSSLCQIVIGTTETLDSAQVFDTLLYMDVLEHIEDHVGEMRRAASRLAPGGNLIVLVPAHQFLYSPFDKAVGHCRRYTTSSLAAVMPPDLSRTKLIYLDSVGFAASLANRLLLRSSMPTPGQIALWDRSMVPLSRIVDPLLFYRFGKSALAIYSKR